MPAMTVAVTDNHVGPPATAQQQSRCQDGWTLKVFLVLLPASPTGRFHPAFPGFHRSHMRAQRSSPRLVPSARSKRTSGRPTSSTNIIKGQGSEILQFSTERREE